MHSLVWFLGIMFLVGLGTAFRGRSGPFRPRLVPSLTWTLGWLTLPLVFSFALYGWEPLRGWVPGGEAPLSPLKFLSVSLLEISLTGLNLVLVALFLARRKGPTPYRDRLLTVALVGIVATRMVALPSGLYLMSGGAGPARGMAVYLLVYGLLVLIDSNPFDLRWVRSLKRGLGRHLGVTGRLAGGGSRGPGTNRRTPPGLVAAGGPLSGWTWRRRWPRPPSPGPPRGNRR